MKKLFFLLSVPFMVSGMLLSSCDGGKKLAPEDEVRNYGKNFVEKLSANQLDSLTASYPDLVNAESLVPVQSDTILVAETAPGQFNVTLAEGITLKVNRSDDGNITVTESKGLFTFPDDKVELAKKTGMWDDNLSDAQLSERMKDDEFFTWVKNNKDVKTKNIISVGKTIEDGGIGDLSDPYLCHAILTNNSDVPINGSEYMTKWEYWNSYQEHNPTYDYEKGKDIPANGSVRIDWSYGGESEYYLKGIKWNLSPEQLKEKFEKPFTGNEYQEYLNSKK